MKIPRILPALLLCLSVYGFTGCGIIFTPKRQRVTINTATPGATIKYGGDSVGVGTFKKKILRKDLFKSISVEKEGYKTRNYCFQLTKLSALYPITILDIFILGPVWEWWLPKMHKYNKVQTVPELLPMEKRKSTEKYLWVNATAIDTKGSDVNFVKYTGIQKFEKKTQTPYVATHKKSGKKKEDVTMENTIFTDELNRSLVKMNFIDTTHTVFPSVGNSMYLNATIKKITFHEITYTAPSNYQYSDHLLCIELDIEWDLLDFYKQSVYKTHTNKKSDLFRYNGYGSNAGKNLTNVINEALGDNLQYSLLALRKELNDKKYLTAGTGNEAADSLSVLMLSMPAAPQRLRLNEYLKSTVSIKVDEGHGSGVVVSEDGYIISNYHVIAGSKKMEILFNDGTKADAEVVRTNPVADLALLKVKKTGLLPLALSSLKDPEIGIDVWAIGTPKSLELGQSVSKGIISGVRKTNEITFLQTDVKVSPGNSGGALVNKDGLVLGIVSSKLMSKGTEGVAFAILSTEIFDKLKIKYKQ